MTDYTVVDMPGEGLLRVFDTGYGRTRLWHAGRARKPYRCAICGAARAVGEHAFRPVDNGMDRYRRICVSCAAGRRASDGAPE